LVIEYPIALLLGGTVRGVPSIRSVTALLPSVNTKCLE